MQIFRPYVDHRMSAAFLDDLRLGKQRVEAKQVIKVILRRLGLINDGRRGWWNHPIVLMYFNGGEPYIEDLVKYFDAVVGEWVARGRRSSLGLGDLAPYLEKVWGASGTPITHIHEVEYRRVLLLKDPCFYLKKLSPRELEEVIETEPVPINGVNTWLFKRYERYREFIAGLRRGEVDCRPLFEHDR
ncbi:MAG: pyrimidine dimer DNA glycosylase/endonuclease V [Pyrobaculum sp.]|uniref:pyrimidine dimer DNA glycosylase/endonuclease V n=1 Tax=Pyrobaculum sp. TaxID=2004705 RepID=UPI003CAB22F3